MKGASLLDHCSTHALSHAILHRYIFMDGRQQDLYRHVLPLTKRSGRRGAGQSPSHITLETRHSATCAKIAMMYAVLPWRGALNACTLECTRQLHSVLRRALSSRLVLVAGVAAHVARGGYSARTMRCGTRRRHTRGDSALRCRTQACHVVQPAQPLPCSDC